MPFLLWMQVALWFACEPLPTYGKVFLFVILVSINILGFDRSYYLPAGRRLSEFSDFARKLIDSNLLDKKDRYNLFVVRETPYAIAGWEYRFWLKKYGYDPLSSFEYNRSDKMLVIAEQGQKIDLPNLKTWEFSEFGEYNIARTERIGEREVAVLGKVD